MIEFQIIPQGGGGVAVVGYREGGRHVGAVARMDNNQVIVVKPISLDGLAKIADALRARLDAESPAPSPEPPAPSP